MNMISLLLSASLSLAVAQEAEPPAEPGPADPGLTEAERADTDASASDAMPDAGDETASVDPIPSMAADAARASAWLAGLDTLSARFLQIAADGTRTEGALHIARPGRARFDYDDPSPVLVVADGATVAIADFALETIDRAPIGATPLRFLLSENADLAATGAVADVGRSQARLFLTLVDPGGELDGRLTLVFDDPDPLADAETMRLAGWYAVDALGGLTEISLSEVETGVRLDPRLFVLDDDDVTEGDRRRRRGR